MGDLLRAVAGNAAEKADFGSIPFSTGLAAVAAASKWRRKGKQGNARKSRMSEMERQFMENVQGTQDFKDMMKVFSNDFSESMSEIKEMQDWQLQGWLGPRVLEYSNSILRSCWSQIGGSHEKSVTLEEENGKLKARLMDLQRRSLQEIAVLRDKVRNFTPGEERELLEVEYYDPLEYVEPSLRDLCKEIIRETVKKLFCLGKDEADGLSSVKPRKMQAQGGDVEELQDRIRKLEGLMQQANEEKEDLREKLVQAENVADEMHSRQREAGMDQHRKTGKLDEDLQKAMSQLDKLKPKSEVIQSPCTKAFHGQVVVPGMDVQNVQSAAGMWHSDAIRYGPACATKEEAERNLEALLAAIEGKEGRGAVAALNQVLESMSAKEDPASPKMSSHHSGFNVPASEDIMRETVALKAELAEEVSHRHRAEKERDTITIERDQLRGTLRQVQSDKVEVEQALKAVQEGMPFQPNSPKSMSPVTESPHPMSPKAASPKAASLHSGGNSSHGFSRGFGGGVLSPQSPEGGGFLGSDEVMALQERAETAAAELAKKDNELIKLRKECADMQNLIKNLEKSLGEQKRLRVESKEEVATLQKKTEDVEIQHRRASIKLEADFQTKINKQQEEMEVLRKQSILNNRSDAEVKEALDASEQKNQELVAENKKLLLEIAELQEQFNVLKQQLSEAGISEDKFDTMLKASAIKAAMLLRSQKKVFDRLYDDAMERAERAHKALAEKLKAQVQEYKKQVFAVLPPHEAKGLFPNDAIPSPLHSHQHPVVGLSSGLTTDVLPPKPQYLLHQESGSSTATIYQPQGHMYQPPTPQLNFIVHQTDLPEMQQLYHQKSPLHQSSSRHAHGTPGEPGSPTPATWYPMLNPHEPMMTPNLKASGSATRPPNQNETPPPPTVNPMASTVPAPNTYSRPFVSAPSGGGFRNNVQLTVNTADPPSPRVLAPGLRLAPLSVYGGYHEPSSNSQTVHIMNVLTDLRTPVASHSPRKRPRSASPPAQARQRTGNDRSSPHIPGSTEPRRLLVSKENQHSQSTPSLHVGRPLSPSRAPMSISSTGRKLNRSPSPVGVLPLVTGDFRDYGTVNKISGRAQVVRQTGESPSPGKEKQTAVRIAVPELGTWGIQVDPKVELPKDRSNERQLSQSLTQSPKQAPRRKGEVPPQHWLPPKLKDVLK